MDNHRLIFDSGCCKWFESEDEQCTPQPCSLHPAAPELLRELIRLVNRCPGRMHDSRYPNWHDGCCTDARALILRVQGKEPS